MPWPQLVWRQIVSAAPLAILLYALPHRHALPAMVIGVPCYLLGLRLLRAFTPDEWQVVSRVLPTQRILAKLASLRARIVPRRG
jgi:hypothetical protein